MFKSLFTKPSWCNKEEILSFDFSKLTYYTQRVVNEEIRRNITDEMMDDVDVILYLIDNRIHIELKRIGPTVSNNKMVVRALAIRNEFSFTYASSELKNDKPFVMDILQNHKNIYPRISDELKKDKDIAIYRIKYISTSLCHIKQFCDDYDVVVVAINRDYEEYRHISDRLKCDPRIIDIALGKNSKVLKYFNDEFRLDMSIVKKCIASNYIAIRFSEPLLKDYDNLVELMDVNPLILRYASREHKRDKDLVLKAVKSDGIILKYMNKEMKNDIEVVYEAYMSNNKSIRFIGRTLLKDMDCDVNFDKNKLIQYVDRIKSNRAKSARNVAQ